MPLKLFEVTKNDRFGRKTFRNECAYSWINGVEEYIESIVAWVSIDTADEFVSLLLDKF